MSALPLLVACSGALADPEPDVVIDGPATIEDGCAPDDGPASELTFGDGARSCGATIEGPTVRVALWDIVPDELEPGEYSISQDADGAAWYHPDGESDAEIGSSAEIDLAEVDPPAGTWEVVLSDGTVVAGTIEGGERCPDSAMCG